MSPPAISVTPLASTSSLSPDPPLGDPGRLSKTKKTRTRNGCLTCRSRKKRCDEQRPKCDGCSRLALECQWEDKEKAAVERRQKRELRKKERAQKQEPQDDDLHGLEALATAGLISSMSAYSPPPTGEAARMRPQARKMADDAFTAASSSQVLFEYSPHDRPVPLPPNQPEDNQQSWTGFLGSFAPGPSDVGWTTSFPQLVAPPTPQHNQHTLVPTNTGQHSDTDHTDGVPQLTDLDITSWLNHGDIPLTFSSLIRSRSPSPARPFDPDLSALFPSFGDFDILNLPPDALSSATVNSAESLALVAQSALPPPLPAPTPQATDTSAHSPPSAVSTPRRFPTAVTRATSFLASSDFAFTQAYLLSHYTTSLAQHVSIASSSSSSNPSSPASPPTARTNRNSTSTSASANLFLSLIPHAHKNPFLMHSILSWSSANLAAASTLPSPPSAPASTAPGAGGGGSHSAMGTLSDELGTMAEGLFVEVIPELERKRPGAGTEERGRTASRDSASSPRGNNPRAATDAVEFEPILAGVLMLCQAAICRGDVEKWRERLRQAAQVINLVGGLAECRSPLARQLVRNLLYHDVLSSSSSKHGLLLDYSSLRPPAAEGTTPASSKNSTAGTCRENGEEATFEAGDDEEVLDTLMGVAEPVFLLIGRITSLAREKHEATKISRGMIPEEDLSTFLRRVDDVRAELELEKGRVDAFVLERPDLEPHRYFHEVFRLAALLYLQMVSEIPPRAFPVLLLVRKMLNLFEVIVKEKLPGLCSAHFALYVMHLNSTPLVSPHSELDDRQRSARVFDHHMEAFAFLNTKRSRALIDEAWRRSNDGRLFVNPDDILSEWGWHLNFA
ncbi:hypothetical protein JCM11491_005045 [Sporobolomyces phaffii]